MFPQKVILAPFYTYIMQHTTLIQLPRTVFTCKVCNRWLPTLMFDTFPNNRWQKLPDTEIAISRASSKFNISK